MAASLHLLPRFSDGWTFVYVEHAHVERSNNTLQIVDNARTVTLPCTALSVLLLGPGTTITHAAAALMTECGASLVWCGEGMVRMYACGLGETRRSANAMHHARTWADDHSRMQVVLRMYKMRFAVQLDDSLTLEQIRGKEGVRVREAYKVAAEKFGVAWSGRQYRQGDWDFSDPLNRSLSTANACLYGLCHAGVVAAGFLPALGFVHSGKALSFVYDIADLYKCDVILPVAFEAVREGGDKLEQRVRKRCREMFFRERLLERIVPDIQGVLGLRRDRVMSADLQEEADVIRLWDPQGDVRGSKNYGS